VVLANLKLLGEREEITPYFGVFLQIELGTFPVRAALLLYKSPQSLGKGRTLHGQLRHHQKTRLCAGHITDFSSKTYIFNTIYKLTSEGVFGTDVLTL
jgi:hypothetical protein